VTRGGWTSSGEWVPVPYVDERATEAARILRAAFGMARSASGDSSRLSDFLAVLGDLRVPVDEEGHEIQAG